MTGPEMSIHMKPHPYMYIRRGPAADGYRAYEVVGAKTADDAAAAVIQVSLELDECPAELRPNLIVLNTKHEGYCQFTLQKEGSMAPESTGLVVCLGLKPKAAKAAAKILADFYRVFIQK